VILGLGLGLLAEQKSLVDLSERVAIGQKGFG
jgi:hypothetical protein